MFMLDWLTSEHYLNHSIRTSYTNENKFELDIACYNGFWHKERISLNLVEPFLSSSSTRNPTIYLHWVQRSRFEHFCTVGTYEVALHKSTQKTNISNKC